MKTSPNSRREITRRGFLQAALATGTAVALPLTGIGKQLVAQLPMGGASGTAPSPLPGGPFFLTRTFNDAATNQTHDLYAIAEAICARIVPTDALGPGAAEAGAVNYIDLFVGAFAAPLLAPGLVDNPAIYLNGPYSGRWPSGDVSTGRPETINTTPDSFENAAGQIQFLGLTPNQAIAWYLRIYGRLPLTNSPWKPPPWVTNSAPPGYLSWRSQATPSGLIPGAQDLQSLYQEGLSSFDTWSQQNYGTPFASAKAPEQDALLALAWNPLLGAASKSGFPGLPTPLVNPVPPPAAASLFGTMVLHSIQGTYCLPEYDGGSDSHGGGQVTWTSIGFDGDTQPLGNSIYDATLMSNIPSEPDNP
ncbi:MAG: gluconate 2-dehydrogenase subunit 3 family protein, partial [Acidimicrobiales bacterium]